MNQAQIDRRLTELSRTARPTAPDLRSEVRAEISHRRSRSGSGWILALFNWNELLLQPRVAAGALAAALAIGFLPGALPFFRTQSETEVVQARRSLHLDVFSPVGLLPPTNRNTSR